MRTSRWTLIFLFAVLASAAQASEFTPATGANLLASVVASHASLRSYAAAIRADFRAQTFPFVRMSLEGSAYYRAPDRYAVIFRNPPSYMKGFAEGYAIMMDVGSWHKYFNAAALPDRVSNGRSEHVLRLSGNDPKSFLRQGNIYIDAATDDITRMDWEMTNGMTFDLQQTYVQMPSGYHVVAKQNATFHVPFAHGVATMTLSDYRCNVTIGDDVFEVAEQSAFR